MTSLPISIPVGFTPSVSIGTSVNVGQAIATKSAQTDERISIADALSVTPKQARKLVKKIPGERVEKGDILAEKSNFLGTSKVVLRSKVAGTVTRFERDSGNLIIQTASSTSSIKEIISPVDGIVQMCDNREIVINTDKNVIVGSNGSGEKISSDIYVLPEDDAYHLNSHTIGKIAVSKKFSREMILKGIGIEAAGIIGVEIDDNDIDYLTDKNFKIALIKVSEDQLSLLREWSGKKVFMNPETETIIFLQV